MEKNQAETNVILITADQLRFDTLGFMGSSEVKTPNLDKLAGDGVVFERCYTTNPVCMPARASLLLGQYPDTHGVRRNGINVPDKPYGLARILSNKGYFTGFVGKTHFCSLHNQFDKTETFHNWRIGTDYYGFQYRQITHDLKDYITYHPPYPHRNPPNNPDPRIYNLDDYADWIRQNHPEYYELAICDGLASSSDVMGPELWTSQLPPDLHQTTWITDRAIDFIELSKNETRPFFLWISFVDPHHPFNAPLKYRNMYDKSEFADPIYNPDEFKFRSKYHIERSNQVFKKVWEPGQLWREYRAQYYAMVTLIDENIGRIISALKDAKLDENTVIIFTADHGEMLGDHQLERKGLFHYEQLIRIPLLIYCPRRFQTGRIRKICQNVDISATILDLCGISKPVEYQGISLVPYLNGIEDKPIREYALITNGGEGPHYKPWPELRTLVTKRYKLNHYINENHFEIDDLEENPDETKPIDINRNQQLLTELLAKSISCTVKYSTNYGKQVGLW